MHVCTARPTQYPPFSVVIKLDRHLAEGPAHWIFSVDLLHVLPGARSAEPVLPHQHPALHMYFQFQLNSIEILCRLMYE
jgi:hypothetical protein